MEPSEDLRDEERPPESDPPGMQESEDLSLDCRDEQRIGGMRPTLGVRWRRSLTPVKVAGEDPRPIEMLGEVNRANTKFKLIAKTAARACWASWG